MKRVAPLAILGAAVAIVALIFALQQPIEPRPPELTAPLVRAVTASQSDFQFRVRAQGTVVPRSESDLVPQVSGEVVWVSADLVSGGFFEAGQPLLRIDRADYAVALESARANVARAESEFARAKKERDRQGRLADRSVASQASIDDAENAYRVAEASLRDGRARLEQATRDLERTELRAPYAGRVRQEQVDPGQFASRGVALAKLYAVDYAEVRLPLPDRELAFLEVALARRMPAREAPELEKEMARSEDAANAGAVAPPAVAAETGAPPVVVETELPAAPGPTVLLRADFAGEAHTWTGRIVRTEGEIDPKSRMVQVVARVEDPYGAGAQGRPPLAVGLFVDAEIEGRTAEDVFVLPRSALRRGRSGEGDRVLVIDQDSRLRFRDVDVLRIEHDQVIVGRGLAAGERICISPLRAVTDGMLVRVAGPEGARPELAGPAS
jgi:RND family efflux transporter MFP subunit